MAKKQIVIEVDEDIEPEFRLNLSNWLDDFSGSDVEAGKVRIVPERD